MSAPSSTERFARLAYKYARLVDLRHARARGEPIPARRVFRELAAEFPGCLFELDRLTLADLEARLAASSTAASGGDAPDWARAMVDYHAVYRAALFVKRKTGKRLEIDEARAASLAKAASEHAGVEVDAAFARAAANAPSGRLQPIVLARVGSLHGCDPTGLATLLFLGTRRVRRSDS